MIRSIPAAALGVMISATTARAQVPELPPEPVPPALRDEVIEFLSSYYESFSARDWPRFADHFWPGATITTVYQPEGQSTPRVVAHTVPEFVAAAPMGPDSREIFEERMLAAEVRVRGDLASVFARYRARFGDPGDISEWAGIDSFSLMKQDGEWRIVALSFVPED